MREDEQTMELSFMVGEMWNGAAALENSLAVPQILNVELPCHQVTLSTCTTERNENIRP